MNHLLFLNPFMYILNNCLCCNSPRSEERKFSVDIFFQTLRKITKKRSVVILYERHAVFIVWLYSTEI